MDSDEDNDIGSSWISFKSLKKAADVRAFFHKKAPSPNLSAYTSVNSESLANPAINPSLSFSNIHRKYQEQDAPKPVVKVPDVNRDLAESQASVLHLQRQLKSQEEHWKAKIKALETHLMETDGRQVVGKKTYGGEKRPSLSMLNGKKGPEHAACVSEIEDLKQTVERQERVIEGLQNTIDSLHAKLAEAQQKKDGQAQSVRRRHHVSAMH